MQLEPSLPSSSSTPTPPAAPVTASAPIEEQLSLTPTADDRAADQPPDALQQARASMAAGEWSAAATTLRALVAREPKHARARALLAELLEKKGDVEGALAELGRAIDATPDDVQLLCARAAILTARGRYELAEADLRGAIRAEDRNPAVHIQLGILFCKRARWRDAVEHLRAAVERDPQLVAAHYYLGEAYNSIDDLPAALSAYEHAAQLEPTHLRALKGIGVVLDRLGRPADAAVAYQRARDIQRR